MTKVSSTVKTCRISHVERADVSVMQVGGYQERGRRVEHSSIMIGTGPRKDGRVVKVEGLEKVADVDVSWSKLSSNFHLRHHTELHNFNFIHSSEKIFLSSFILT
jgi:hypothetical protein